MLLHDGRGREGRSLLRHAGCTTTTAEGKEGEALPTAAAIITTRLRGVKHDARAVRMRMLEATGERRGEGEGQGA
jgi:hypothetical protein